jgi:hypothetical protein
MQFVLLITLLVAGQRPYSYQVEFNSQPRCAQARSSLIESYEHDFPKSGLNYSLVCLQKSP